ncbi:MAG: MerR family transcriptional regulator [Gammaproteobacteria bacterium]|nr:MAG: MerR family transcriptional regulator [Gammaproteobacteria bacterium]
MYNISTISNLTGVNPITLRAWERRYGLIKPTRTPKGHRLYSDEDLATINQVVKLLDQGIAVSQVSHYLQPTAVGQPTSFNPWLAYQQRMLLAIINFDEPGLEKIYNETMSLYPVELVTRDLLIPLLRILGERWQSLQTGVGEEHFFAMFMRNKLGARFHHRNLNNRGPKLLAACLPGEHHELGLLLFCLAAHERDYRMILLGANMPLDELAQIAERTRCAAITLSAATLEPPQTLQQDLAMLVKATHLPVFVGGKIVNHHRTLIEQAGAIATHDDISSSLQTLHNHLQLASAGDTP